MGMIQIDNVMRAPVEPQVAAPTENITCLVIRTGNINRVAHFYPGLYQLTLVTNGVEEKVDLGFSGSRLLERLVRNPGEVVDRDELMNHAWSGRVVGQGSLNQQIYTLRQILADESAREIIQTLPRRGYFINPNYIDIALEPSPVSAAPAPVQPVAIAAPAPTVQEKPTVKPTAQRKWLLPAFASLSALLTLGAIAYNQPAENTNPTAAMGKLLTITYAPRHPDELSQMIPHGEKIERSLASKINTPLHVVISDLHENALDLVCLLADGSARTLHIANSRLDQLSDSDWAPCLK